MLSPGYQLTKALIGSSKKIIKEYDLACRATVSSGALVDIEIAKDSGCGNMTSLFDQRRKEVKYQINSLLYGLKGFGKGGSVQDKSHVMDNDIWTSFAKTEEDVNKEITYKSKGEGWADVSKHAVRDIRRMVNHLPEDT